MSQTTNDGFSVSLPGTSLPPLTTVFTPSTECETRWLHWITEFAEVESGFDYSDAVDTDYVTGCILYGSSAEYSPGVCFSGQTLAKAWKTHFEASGSNEIRTIWFGQCCKSGMFLQADIVCKSIFTTPFTAMAPFTMPLDYGTTTSTEVVYDIAAGFYSKGTGTVSTYVTRAKNTVVFTSGVARAKPVAVYWESKDLSLFPSSYATSLASAFGPLDPATSTSSAALPSAISSHTTLKTTQKAGIGVAVVVSAMLLGAVLLMYTLRKRKKRPAPGLPGVPEMTGASKGLRRFLRGNWRAEVEGTSDPMEIDSRNVLIIPGPPVELRASN